MFTKNCDRLLGGEIGAKFFAAVLDHVHVKGLLSDDHFLVDGTLTQWASLRSFRPKDGSGDPPAPGRNGERDFSEKWSNETHRSTTDDNARLFRKSSGQARELRELGITPHVAQNAYETATTQRCCAIDGRTTRHAGYTLSQRKRKRIEEIFGWLKTIGGCGKPGSVASTGSGRLPSLLPPTT